MILSSNWDFFLCEYKTVTKTNSPRSHVPHLFLYQYYLALPYHTSTHFSLSFLPLLNTNLPTHTISPSIASVQHRPPRTRVSRYQSACAEDLRIRSRASAGTRREQEMPASSAATTTAAASAPSEFVTIVSNDGYEFVIRRSAAYVSGALRRMLNPNSTFVSFFFLLFVCSWAVGIGVVCCLHLTRVS